MKRITVNTSTLTLAIAFALPSFTLRAQDENPPHGGSASTLDAVKVMARKREETLQDVPVAAWCIHE